MLAALDAPLTGRARSGTPTNAPLDGTGSPQCRGAASTSLAPGPSGVALYTLRAGAFPDPAGAAGSAEPNVAVHVPEGFDATRRPGLVVYFHGWLGCVANALGVDDAPCADGGLPRTATNLVAPFDAAHVNALLVAIELRADMPTGEPGRLAMPGGLRDLLRELFTEPLARSLGTTLDVDALDRVVVVAHSGGYQAAASAVTLGDVPRITEVDLLDALYGGEPLFARWVDAQVGRFDSRVSDPLRFVDLYTCCGGTADRSRALAFEMRAKLEHAGLSRELAEGNEDEDVRTHAVVFNEVGEPHDALPFTYLQNLVESAGFAHMPACDSHSLRPN